MSNLGVNPNFIEPGHLHECVRFSSDPAQRNRFQAIWIESVEILAGQVFLGIRLVLNWKDENDYELGEVVHYENLLAFNIIQKIGTAKRREDELKVRNDKLLKEQQELQEQEQGKENE
jgi:hypothetical protein